MQAGNFIGTLDPKAPDGAIKLVESPTVNSRPHGVRLDSKGVPFFDRVQLEQDRQRRSEDAGHHRSIRCPNKDARPRRIAIGKDDTVWYGDYARGFLGHLDPKTGKVEEFASPGGAGLEALRDRRHRQTARSGTSRPATRRRTCWCDSTPRRRSS